MVISLLFGTVDICSPRPLALRSCACWSTFLDPGDRKVARWSGGEAKIGLGQQAGNNLQISAEYKQMATRVVLNRNRVSFSATSMLRR
jgi:hypothetical protein